MKLTIILAAFLGFTATALAQQQQITPSQMAIQIDNAVNGLATSIELLQKQLAQSEAQVKQLQDKYEPRKPSPATSGQK